MQDIEHPWPVSITIPVLWGDMDAFNHVNNVRYFRWFESARIAYFEALGLKTLLSNQKLGPILAHASCDYQRPLTYPDTVELKARTVKLGTTSFTQEYLAISQRTQQICAKGVGVIVLIDYETGQKIPLDEPFKEKVKTFEITKNP